MDRTDTTPRSRSSGGLHFLSFCLASLLVATAGVTSSLADAYDTCTTCHTDVGTSHHNNVFPSVGCTSCHPMHGPVNRSAICGSCHGSPDDAHGNVNHTAAPGTGPVVIFADTSHDSAGRVGEKPYFDVLVNCTTCHSTDLPAVHGGDCATCHPAPYDSLGTWGQGCQQGACHPSYHEDSTAAHSPFEDTSGSTANDCGFCHQGWGVPQSACQNCHATYDPGDVTSPVTTSSTVSTYIGPAKIDFSITDNGKVAAGRTFYRLDGGPVTASGKDLFLANPGTHQLEFWSKDQAGNTEVPTQNVSFTIVADTTSPTTTSDAQATYSQGATITLTAVDASTLGVRSTYYRLNGGATQSGRTVVIPGTSGTIAYTLAFWSEDWSGNVESEKTANFTVSSGGGTLRLIWGSSDSYGSPCPGDPDANAVWTVRSGNASGPVIASGTGGCPNWSGVADITVPVGSTLYTVVVDWWDSYYEVDERTVFSNVSVTTPGQVVRLAY